MLCQAPIPVACSRTHAGVWCVGESACLPTLPLSPLSWEPETLDFCVCVYSQNKHPGFPRDFFLPVSLSPSPACPFAPGLRHSNDPSQAYVISLMLYGAINIFDVIRCNKVLLLDLTWLELPPAVKCLYPLQTMQFSCLSALGTANWKLEMIARNIVYMFPCTETDSWTTGRQGVKRPLNHCSVWQ